MINIIQSLLSFRFFFVCVICGPGYLFANDNAGLLDEWYTEDKKAKVEFYECDEEVCGKIVWMKEPREEDGTLKTDSNNPDESKRDNPMLGLRLIHGLHRSSQNKWKDGKIYNPENGKTYQCKVTIKDDKLKIRGFLQWSLFGRNQTWTRVENE